MTTKEVTALVYEALQAEHNAGAGFYEEVGAVARKSFAHIHLELRDGTMFLVQIRQLK